MDRESSFDRYAFTRRPKGKLGRAWDRGVTAADLNRKRLPPKACPYADGTPRARAWHQGFQGGLK